MNLNDIEYSGRVARENGHAQVENPYFRPENTPRHTGESVDEWQAKIESWETGWRQGLMQRCPM